MDELDGYVRGDGADSEEDSQDESDDDFDDVAALGGGTTGANLVSNTFFSDRSSTEASVFDGQGRLTNDSDNAFQRGLAATDSVYSAEKPGDIQYNKQPCSFCRKSHSKCDRLLPQCSICTKRGKVCEYEHINPTNKPPPPSKRRKKPADDAAAQQDPAAKPSRSRRKASTSQPKKSTAAEESIAASIPAIASPSVPQAQVDGISATSVAAAAASPVAPTNQQMTTTTPHPISNAQPHPPLSPQAVFGSRDPLITIAPGHMGFCWLLYHQLRPSSGTQQHSDVITSPVTINVGLVQQLCNSYFYNNTPSTDPFVSKTRLEQLLLAQLVLETILNRVHRVNPSNTQDLAGIYSLKQGLNCVEVRDPVSVIRAVQLDEDEYCLFFSILSLALQFLCEKRLATTYFLDSYKYYANHVQELPDDVPISPMVHDSDSSHSHSHSPALGSVTRILNASRTLQQSLVIMAYYLQGEGEFDRAAVAIHYLCRQDIVDNPNSIGIIKGIETYHRRMVVTNLFLAKDHASMIQSYNSFRKKYRIRLFNTTAPVAATILDPLKDFNPSLFYSLQSDSGLDLSDPWIIAWQITLSEGTYRDEQSLRASLQTYRVAHDAFLEQQLVENIGFSQQSAVAQTILEEAQIRQQVFLVYAKLIVKGLQLKGFAAMMSTVESLHKSKPAQFPRELVLTLESILWDAATLTANEITNLTMTQQFQYCPQAIAGSVAEAAMMHSLRAMHKRAASAEELQALLVDLRAMTNLRTRFSLVSTYYSNVITQVESVCRMF